jgi:hypothetical protein
MAASALEAAVRKVMSSYIAAHRSISSSGSSDDNQQQQQQQGPVQFAVLFKNRDSTAPKAKQSGKTEQQQQQPDASERLDKSRAINIAVAAVHECSKDAGGAKVNLSQPEVTPAAVNGAASYWQCFLSAELCDDLSMILDLIKADNICIELFNAEILDLVKTTIS